MGSHHVLVFAETSGAPGDWVELAGSLAEIAGA